MTNSNSIKILFKGSQVLKLSDTETRQCNFYSIKTASKKTVVNHHILLVDVSESMCNEITELKNRLKMTLEALCKRKNNYVSIIIYSGHDECYRIVNGVKCSKTDFAVSQVYETIEAEVYSRGITVISEPLEKALEIAKKLADICHKHHIAVFTDGYLVPLKWSIEDEEKKCLEISELCKKENIFFNAIGFGKYYDREFLKRLVGVAGNGRFMHIDEIEDYFSTVASMIESVNSMNVVDISVNNEDYFIINSAERMNGPSVIKNVLSNQENILVVFDDNLKVSDMDIKYEGRKKNKEEGSKLNKKVSEELVNDFLYSLSLNCIKKENIRNAQIAIAKTGDIYAYKSILGCYSFLEKGRVINLLNKCVTDKKERFKEGKEEIRILSYEEEPLCLLEILREIFMDNGSRLLWDFKYPYKRIGMKKNILDDRYKFEYDKNGYGEIVDVIIGSKKLNIGVKVKINGEVKDSISKLKLDSCIFKEYNIIVNGNINTSELWCTLSRKLKIKLNKQGVIKKTIKWNDQSISILDITKVKSTNMRLLKSIKQEEISKYLYEIEILGCKQWALKQHINDLIREKRICSLDNINLYDEEKIARSTFRVDSKGIFNPLKAKEINEGSYEVYPARILEWKIEKFQKTIEQRKALEEYQKLLKEDTMESYRLLIEELNIVKRHRFNKQFLVNLVRISSGIMDYPVFVWEDEKEKFKKETDKILNRNMIINEKVNISTKRIGDIVLREDRYTVLVKCN